MTLKIYIYIYLCLLFTKLTTCYKYMINYKNHWFTLLLFKVNKSINTLQRIDHYFKQLFLFGNQLFPQHVFYLYFYLLYGFFIVRHIPDIFMRERESEREREEWKIKERETEDRERNREREFQTCHKDCSCRKLLADSPLCDKTCSWSHWQR